MDVPVGTHKKGSPMGEKRGTLEQKAIKDGKRNFLRSGNGLQGQR